MEVLIDEVKLAEHHPLIYALYRLADKELNQLALEAWHFVFCGVDEPLLAEVVRLKEHQVKQRVGLAHVGVAYHNHELTVF